MIEFSQAELLITIDILQSELDQLDPDRDQIPEELQSILSKLKAVQVKPTPTAELFGIDRK